MRAITYYEYGPPEVLKLEETAEPELRPKHIKIRVHAAEATKTDCEWRSFSMNVKWFWLPLRIAIGVLRPRRPILGGYFAGTVVELGEDAAGFSVGDTVYGCALPRAGAYAEVMVLPARYPIGPKPANMNFAEAAALPLGGLNALHFMELAQLTPGTKVLINGAGGSIGAYAVQIAKAFGAEVTAVDIGYKEAALRQFGADHFIDYTRRDFTREEATYDVIFDMVPDTDYRGCLARLNPGGRYLNGNPRLATLLKIWWTDRFTDTFASFAFAPETKSQLNKLKDMVERGEIESIVERTYPMSQAAAAHHRVESEARLGAIVIDLEHETS